MLKGKVAFITGSTRGIGWSTARTFASHGATVVLHGHSSQEALDARLAELGALYPGTRCQGCLADFGDLKQIDGCFQKINKEYKRLDVLVNNAGVMNDALIGMISSQMIQSSFALNAIAVAVCIQTGARLMLRSGGGSIINISSIIGVNGNEGQLVYAGTKAAVIGMTKSAAKELAPSIRVNAVTPGIIDTDLVRHLPPVKVQERLNSVKMKRIGQPEEVANAILFLASDLSSYITGQVLGVDGGFLI